MKSLLVVLCLAARVDGFAIAVGAAGAAPRLAAPHHRTPPTSMFFDELKKMLPKDDGGGGGDGAKSEFEMPKVELPKPDLSKVGELLRQWPPKFMLPGEPAADAAPVEKGTPIEVDDSWTTTASGLRYIDERVGSGDEVLSGQTVKVDYTGWLEANGREFDSSRGRSPIAFPVGGGRVIPGEGRYE